MRRLRVIVADDELLARQRTTRLVTAMADLELVAVCDSAEALLGALDEHGADVVLLDIHMPGLSGLETAALLPEPRPAIIFVTAHAAHALAAFETGAVDYVLKPVDPVRLRRAVDRVAGRASPVERLPIPTQGGIVLVDPSRMSHASFDGSLVTVHTSQGDHISDLSLSELEARLPSDFERVHRRYLLAFGHVERLLVAASGTATAFTTGGHQVPVSRAAARRLRKRLGC